MSTGPNAGRKIPSRTIILGEPFRVELVPDLLSDDEAVSGETLGESHRIRINASLDTEKQWRTFIHESLHSGLHVNGYGNVSDSVTEEMIVQTLEYVVVQMIRQHGKQLLEVFGDD